VIDFEPCNPTLQGILGQSDDQLFPCGSKGHGRRELPKGLKRETVEHDLSAAEKLCPCCGESRVVIGDEVSEKLDCVPASLFVVRHVRKKYGCTQCLKRKAETVDHVDATPSEITTAPLPPSVIDRCSAEPGLLAKVIVDKFCDHLPLARQEAIYARQGVHLSRKTMCDWLAACADALTPLYLLMLNRVLKSRVIHCDETRVPVQDAVQVRSGRLWIYLGDRHHPFLVYDYRPNKARAGPAEILKDYRGYLHADAANVFDGLYTPGAIVEVGCWAHARRHVYAALESDVRHAAEGLTRIGGLYDVERTIKNALETQGLKGAEADAFTRAMRQEKSVPMLAAMQTWLAELQPRLLPKSPMGQACNYILRHWAALNRFTTEGYLAIDNIAAERGFRPVGIGRRNWLFAGSDNGGRTAAVLYSLVQSCRSLSVEPWHYLKSTLERLPSTPDEQLKGLLPTASK
jgi:transposase